MYLIKAFISAILFLGLIAVQSAAAQYNPAGFLSDSTTYIWPTNASPYLSSTFAETRSAHLHSGIDIRTWGREGYNVFASRSGEIYRIATGPSGYGNVIYMRHEDGSFTVYAHLNRFEPELQAYADSIRLIDYSFELDHFPGNDRFTYNQGDVIGFSGSTGVGPPHLHFEIRSPDYKPVNPLLSNLSVSDKLPPVFSQLAVEYLHEETLHRTGHSFQQVELSDGKYDFGEITINGPIGLAVNVHDRANSTPNVYAVHSLKLVLDSDTLFHAIANHFTFADGGNMFLDRSYPILAQSRRGFQRLYRVRGNRLPFYQKTVNEGVLSLPEGRHEIKIIAKDIYGNQSEASLTVNSEKSPDVNSISYVPAYPAFENRSTYPLYSWNARRKPVSNIFLASVSTEIMVQTGENSTSHSISAGQRSVRKKLSPNKYNVLHTADQEMWIQFPAQSLHDTLNLKASIAENPARDQIDILFNPGELPLNQPAIINLMLPEYFKNLKGVALFSVNPNSEKQSFIQSDISNGVLRAEVSQIRNLRIQQDHVLPWAGRPQFKKNLAGMDILIIPAVDSDTGINYRRSKILINGRRGIVEYNPDRDWLIYYLPGFVPSSENHIEYEIYDGAGNLNAGTHTLPYSG